MKYYKLTDQNNETHGRTKWGKNVTHEAIGYGTALCSNGVIHVYEDPMLAVLFNPIHANITNPKLWECETSEPVANDGLKAGVKKCTSIREIALPKITIEQKIEFAIRCAKIVCSDKEWNKWADKWLSGEDRSKAAAARAAARAVEAAGAAARAARAAARAAEAAGAAARTAEAAEAAWTAAWAAARATARAAARAVEVAAWAAARRKINFRKIITDIISKGD